MGWQLAQATGVAVSYRNFHRRSVEGLPELCKCGDIYFLNKFSSKEDVCSFPSYFVLPGFIAMAVVSSRRVKARAFVPDMHEAK